VALVGAASESLAKIVASSTRSYEMATRISSALEDQATASRHLHEVTSRMSDHIAEINRATGEQASGTQMLALEAEDSRPQPLEREFRYRDDGTCDCLLRGSNRGDSQRVVI